MRLHRNRRESSRGCGKPWIARLRYRHKQRTLDRSRNTARPMRHQETGEAMGHKQGRRRTGLHGNIQRTNPLVTDWTVPVVQIHTPPIGMAQFPERLLMLRPGIANAG